MLFRHWVRRAASRACCTAGSSSAIRIAMIAMTTSSSISVNPRDLAFIGTSSLVQCGNKKSRSRRDLLWSLLLRGHLDVKRVVARLNIERQLTSRSEAWRDGRTTFIRPPLDGHRIGTDFDPFLINEIHRLVLAVLVRDGDRL